MIPHPYLTFHLPTPLTLHLKPPILTRPTPSITSLPPIFSSLTPPTPSTQTRRTFLTTLTILPPLLLLPPTLPLLSATTTLPDTLQNKVQLYKDLAHGFSIYRPSGWNEFEAQVDQYDIKWQDVIEPSEQITVMTVDSGNAKAVSDLGEVEKVAGKIGKSRKAEVVGSRMVDIGEDGMGYEVEMKRGGVRLITLVTVGRRKLFSVNASCSEKRWRKREGLLKGVVESFRPSL